MDTTRASVSTVTPRRSVADRSASSTVRALFESGKSFPSSSSCKGTPSSSKNRAARSAGNARRTRATNRDGPPQKSRSVTTRLVTLQREPPLTRILAPTRRAPSSTRMRRPGAARAAKTAVASPAAPPPTTMTSTSVTDGTSVLFSYGVFGPNSAVAHDAGQEHRACHGLPGQRPHHGDVVLRRADGPGRELRHDGARPGTGRAHSRDPAARRLDRRRVTRLI